MAILTWVCIVVDLVIAVFLLAILFNANQDAAGKGMIMLPIILLLVFAGGAWFLLCHDYHVAALLVSGIPALIAAYFLYLEFKNKGQ